MMGHIDAVELWNVVCWHDGRRTTFGAAILTQGIHYTLPHCAEWESLGDGGMESITQAASFLEDWAKALREGSKKC